MTEGKGSVGASQIHTFVGHLMSCHAFHVIRFNTPLVRPTVVRSGPAHCILGKGSTTKELSQDELSV